MQLLLIAALAFAGAVAVFALQNAHVVSIRFFGWEREASVAIISLGSAALGALCAILTGLVRQLGVGLKNRQLRAELAKLQRELEEERKERRELAAELERVRERALGRSRADALPESGVFPRQGGGVPGEPPEPPASR